MSACRFLQASKSPGNTLTLVRDGKLAEAAVSFRGERKMRTATTIVVVGDVPLRGESCWGRAATRQLPGSFRTLPGICAWSYGYGDEHTRQESSSTTVSNESGSYTIPSLLPGTYKLSATLPGFQDSHDKRCRVGFGRHGPLQLQTRSRAGSFDGGGYRSQRELCFRNPHPASARSWIKNQCKTFLS